MERTLRIAVIVIVCAHSLITASAQTAKDKNIAELRHMQVNAKTIARLPNGGKYVVDLTRRGVIYHFDSTARPIDFTRVTVSTTSGEVAMGSWLEKTFSKKALTGWDSGSFRIGTTKDFRKIKGLPPITSNPPSGSANFMCNLLYCVCRGDSDCNDMFSTNVCGPYAVCINGTCACSR